MTDSRFPTPGQDTRFATPGADARFPSPGTDTRFPSPGTDTRFDGSAPPDLNPPVNLTAPRLVLEDPTTLVYTVGTWGGLVPITLEGRIWLNGVDVAPAAPGLINVLPEWRGQLVAIFEIATNDDGQMFASSNQVSIPVPADPPSLVTAAVLSLSGDNNTLTYTAGVWTGAPAPTVTATLNIADGPEDIPASPGNIPVDEAWRGKSASVLESASNDGGVNSVTQRSNVVPITAPPPPNLGQQVQAILAGRGGLAFDPRDKSTLFQDAAGTVPVTADGQPIGRLVRKYGDTAEAFTQATAANRPTLFNGEISFDGVSDTFNTFTKLGFFANVAGALWCYKVTLDLVGRGNARITQATTGTNGVVERFSTIIEVSGATANICRKQDGSNPFHRPGGGATVPVATPSVVSFIGDFVDDTLENRVRGTSFAKADMVGAPVGNMPNTPSLNIQLGVALQACKLGRLVMLPFLPTPAEILTLEAWVNEAP